MFVYIRDITIYHNNNFLIVVDEAVVTFSNKVFFLWYIAFSLNFASVACQTYLHQFET